MKLSRSIATISTILLSSSLYVACSDDTTAPGGQAGDRGDDDDDTDGTGATDGSGATGGGATGGSGGSGGDDNSGTGALAGMGGDDGDDDGPSPDAVVPAATLLVDNMTNAYGSLIANSGSIYVSGATDVAAATTAASLRLAVWRFTAAGALDTTFGVGGKATSTIASPGTSYDIVELADGSLVVHYSAADGVYLVKVSNLGVFGTPVKVDFSWSSAEVTALNADCVDAAAVQECLDARTTVVGGVCEMSGTTPGANYDAGACAALLAECTSTEAAVECQTAWPAATAPLFTQRPSAYASWGMALDTSGSSERLVVFAHGAPLKVSSGTQRTNNDRFVTRVLASDLSFDTTFNGGAVFHADVADRNLADNARRGFVAEDGSILSTGYTNDGTNHIALIRLLPSGAVDAEYGFSDREPDVLWKAGQTYYNPYRGVTGFAEAYGAAQLSDGSVVTTGYGSSFFEKTPVSVDLVTTRVLADGTGLDSEYGGNSVGLYLGSYSVQSEYLDATNGSSFSREERGRDVVALADDRTVHAGFYDGQTALFVVTPDGKLDETVGDRGLLRYAFERNFFSVNTNADASRLVATTQQRDKVTTGQGSYAKTVVAIVDVTPVAD